MNRHLLFSPLCLALFFGLVGDRLTSASEPADKPVDYARDIKPILSSQCYACHGPDKAKRKGGLRLDLREDAVKIAIKPGSASDSELIARVSSKEAEEVMPPPHSKKGPLAPAQIELLRRWIDQGAKFDVHWAYVKPVRPAVPLARNQAWVRNSIDHFIAAAHEQQRMQPAAETDRATLIRRLSFDLKGLPPTPAEVQAFLNDTSPEAYEKLVDQFLGSKHFGERMALYWLDLVRFADTAGYHSDNHRDLFLYRDYVIDSFNENKPFDRFTMEQLAGDQLANPTREQRIASGYNRLLMTTEEGGAQAKEYIAKYAADRVRNTSVVWLAGTMGCAECHNHKFDPYSQKDFYSFASFFADLKETPVGRQPQTTLPTDRQASQLQKLSDQQSPLRAKLDMPTPELEEAQVAWERALRLEEARALPKNILEVLLVAPGKRTEKQKQDLAAHYRGVAPLLAPIRQQLAEIERQKAELNNSASTLVSMAGEPRVMRILPRGSWLDDSGEIVQPAVPLFLTPLDVKDRRANRLDLARWLIDRDNPLVARVFVNRLWKLAFGQGLVKTLDDFGTQGALPTHPQLLDWLAVEFVESGWDVKHMLRLILLSNTYRQSSHAARELRDRDPSNQWLARQGSFRLDAELVRDNALAISGLLVPTVGGPSVKPYQPEGYWQYLNFPKRDYQHDRDQNQYRRGLYTYWQRTLPHPSLVAFDAPSREECTVERPRSSTPLQALVLLNDPTYVEAARAFAERILKEGGATPAQRLDWAYRRAVSRPARPAEVMILMKLFEKHRDGYAADRNAAQRLLGTGEHPVPRDVDVAELAAWTSVARTILNLHETITRS